MEMCFAGAIHDTRRTLSGQAASDLDLALSYKGIQRALRLSGRKMGSDTSGGISSNCVGEQPRYSASGMAEGR
jgi:hypothetical protein